VTACSVDAASCDARCSRVRLVCGARSWRCDYVVMLHNVGARMPRYQFPVDAPCRELASGLTHLFVRAHTVRDGTRALRIAW